MAKFIVGDSTSSMLEVVIGDESYNVPLASGLTFDEAAGLESPVGMRAFLEKYIPKKVLKPLTIGQYNSIVEAWNSESGIKAGE